MSLELDVGLIPDPEAPARARRAVATLRGVIEGACVDDLRLLVSELVTNAVQHRRTDPEATDPARWIRLRVTVRPNERIRTEVIDPGGTGTPLMRDVRDGHVSGWGLTFVDRLASRWGVEEDEGTTVWFEVDLDRDRV